MTEPTLTLDEAVKVCTALMAQCIQYHARTATAQQRAEARAHLKRTIRHVFSVVPGSAVDGEPANVLLEGLCDVVTERLSCIIGPPVVAP